MRVQRAGRLQHIDRALLAQHTAAPHGSWVTMAVATQRSRSSLWTLHNCATPVGEVDTPRLPIERSRRPRGAPDRCRLGHKQRHADARVVRVPAARGGSARSGSGPRERARRLAPGESCGARVVQQLAVIPRTHVWSDGWGMELCEQ
jgi:hypothetical protein